MSDTTNWPGDRSQGVGEGAASCLAIRGDRGCQARGLGTRLIYPRCKVHGTYRRGLILRPACLCRIIAARRVGKSPPMRKPPRWLTASTSITSEGLHQSRASNATLRYSSRHMTRLCTSRWDRNMDNATHVHFFFEVIVHEEFKLLRTCWR